MCFRLVLYKVKKNYKFAFAFYLYTLFVTCHFFTMCNQKSKLYNYLFVRTRSATGSRRTPTSTAASKTTSSGPGTTLTSTSTMGPIRTCSRRPCTRATGRAGEDMVRRVKILRSTGRAALKRKGTG